MVDLGPRPSASPPLRVVHFFLLMTCMAVVACWRQGLNAKLAEIPGQFRSSNSPADVLPGFTPVSGLGPHRAADDFALPEGEPVELIYGRPAVSPAPTTLRQTVFALLTEFLLRVARSTGGRALSGPVDVIVADHSIVQPDLVYITKKRRSIVRDRIDGAPDLTIEILSPHHMRRDRTDKLALYAEFGVAEYRIVDPREQQFDFLANRNGRFEIQPQLDNRYSSPVMPKLVLDIAAFWDEAARQLDDSEPSAG